MPPALTVHSPLHHPPPRHIIDFSLPPRQRYTTLAAHYKPQLLALTSLFDQLLLDLSLPPKWLPSITRLSKLLLRKLHDREQTQELQGIHAETGIDMYLLVALNVVLDLLMGCTSGAVRTTDSHTDGVARMLHFRTLDWTMDPLRRVVVHLDFVRSKSVTPEKVLASSITYVGFVGVLTGVRSGLSVSLNFRPVHNAKTRAQHFRFYFHHLLVLLGRRPSIASLLRGYLMGESGSANGRLLDPVRVVDDLQSQHTTAAYVVLSDGESTVTMEKDFSDAHVRSSSTFIAITNHDKTDEAQKAKSEAEAANNPNGPALRQSGIQNDIIEDSEDRLRCIQQKWERKQGRALRIARRNAKTGTVNDDGAKYTFPNRKELLQWLSDWPTTNETTHYAAILDPVEGEVAWSRVYLDPLREAAPRA